MPNGINGPMQSKTVREAYVDQSPYNKKKKRKSFTRLHSYDDSDISYRNAPEYLKQLMNNTPRLTRTNSASEMTSRILGNPKYKAQEDYYDEVQSLKKELKYFKDDNSNLRARIRRLEEDNARKRKEIDNIYETNNGDSRRTSVTSLTTSTNNNVIMNLKQRLFKLESQLKQKETTIDEMKNDPRWTKGTELEIQNRALFNEVEKQKIGRLNFIQHDYMAAIDEEKKHAVIKLETEKQELKIENESLKKKVREFEKSERSEQLSSRHHDESSHRKIEHLKELCEKYENEIHHIKDHLKQIRRERDKYRDKFDNINDDFEEIKRQRDHYRQKLNRFTHEFDEGRYEHERKTDRYSPALKHDDERYNKRISRRRSDSSEERSKKDSRPSTPIRRSNERSSLISKKSFQNLRHDDWTKHDDYRIKRFREKHAAVVIQRGWRKHIRSHKHKTKQDSFDKRHSKIGGMVSPRTSQQKLGSKIDNLGSGTIKTRPSSAHISSDSALKTVQAALRGCINRTELDKISRTQKSQRNEDDDDIIVTSSRQYGNRDSTSKFHRTPSPPFDNYRPSSPHVGSNTGSKQNLFHERNKLGSGNRFSVDDRELPSKTRRTPSPPLDNYRPSSPHVGSSSGSKQNLFHDRSKLGAGNRFSVDDRELPSKTRRTPSPPLDNYRPSSPHVGGSSGSKQNLFHDRSKLGAGNRFSVNDRESTKQRRSPSPSADIHPPSSPRNIGSKQSLLNDKNKFGSGNRLDRESPLKIQRPTTPSNESPRQSNSSLRNSKQFIKQTHNDDDDVFGF